MGFLPSARLSGRTLLLPRQPVAALGPTAQELRAVEEEGSGGEEEAKQAAATRRRPGCCPVTVEETMTSSADTSLRAQTYPGNQ